jgi:ubiquinone/menaquinone biosynthesis C-methylase UbiE
MGIAMTLAANGAGRLLQFVKPIHRKYRTQKIELFLRLIRQRGKGGRLLDVGGGPGIDGEFLELYAAFDEVVVVNLELAEFKAPAGVRVKSIVADGRELPLESGSFDWVFSNAVIEHVGGWEHQERFAQEIQRVAARGYFVTTPNKYFPIEPHAMLPFYQFLPVFLQKKVAPYSPGYLRAYEEINLLSAGQMKKLFPGATVLPVGFPVLGNSLVAYQCGD